MLCRRGCCATRLAPRALRKDTITHEQIRSIPYYANKGLDVVSGGEQALPLARRGRAWCSHT